MPRRTALLVKTVDRRWGVVGSAFDALDIHLLAEAICPVHARAAAADLRPDVILAAPRLGAVAIPPVLLDLQRGPCPTAKIVFFADRLELADLAAAVGLRYHGWLLWPDLTADCLTHSLAAVLAGDVRVGSPSVVNALSGAPSPTDGQPRDALAPRGPQLSPKERDVLTLLAREGDAALSVAEVAYRLRVRPATVQTYLDRIAAKLGLARAGRRVVVHAARQRGLLP